MGRKKTRIVKLKQKKGQNGSSGSANSVEEFEEAVKTYAAFSQDPNWIKKRRRLADQFEKLSFDVNHDSDDFFPIVDFDYLFVYARDPNSNRLDFTPSDEVLREIPSHVRPIKKFFSYTLQGPNAMNLKQMWNSRAFQEYKAGKATHEEWMSSNAQLKEMDFALVKSSPQFLEAALFYRHAFSTTSKFLSLFLDKTPFLKKYDLFQSKHAKLQNKFNRETLKSQKTHRRLEEIVIGDCSTEKSERELNETADNIGYDVGLLYRLNDEMQLLRKACYAIDIKSKGAKSDKAISFYYEMLSRKRTYSDLVRNLSLKYVADAVKQGQQLYRSIEHEGAAQAFAGEFLNAVDLNKIIEKVLKVDHADLIESIIKNGLDNFDDVYDYYNAKLERIVGMKKEIDKFSERYEKVKSASNVDFLAEALLDTIDFPKKKKFDEKYGEQDDPKAAYEFVQKYISNGGARPLAGTVNPNNLSSWIKFEKDGFLDKYLKASQWQKEKIAPIVEEDVYSAGVLTEFLGDFQTYKEMARELKGYSDMEIPSPRKILENMDFVLMEEFLDVLYTIEAEKRTRDMFNKLKLVNNEQNREQVHIVNQDLGQLLVEDFDYMNQHYKDIRELRKVMLRTSNEELYCNFIDELSSSAGNKGDNDMVLLDYLILASGLDEAVKKRVHSHMITCDTNEVIQKVKIEETPEDLRPEISHLVIVGGYRRGNYSWLDNHFNIGKISIVGPAQVNRLKAMGSSPLYLLLTDKVSHKAEFTIRGNNAEYIRARSSGRSVIITSLQANLPMDNSRTAKMYRNIP